MRHLTQEKVFDDDDDDTLPYFSFSFISIEFSVRARLTLSAFIIAVNALHRNKLYFSMILFLSYPPV